MKAPLKSLAVVIVALTMVSSSVGLIYAAGRGRGHGPDGLPMKKLASALALSAQQKQQVKDILEENRTRMEPIMKQLGTERRVLRELVHSEAFDETAIRAQAAKVAPLEADMMVQRARMWHEVRGVLTPEQVKKLRAIQEQKERGFEKCRPRGAGPMTEE